MNLPDLVNGLFEAGGSLWILDHCRALIRSRQARGVSLGACIYFTGWGAWNIYYYPHLHQFLSFAGGIAIVIANLIWNGLIIYYRWKETHSHKSSDDPREDYCSLCAATRVMHTQGECPVGMGYFTKYKGNDNQDAGMIFAPFPESYK